MKQSINAFLERQIGRFPDPLSEEQHDAFLALVGETYDDHERTRRRLERAMSLMNEELQEQAARRESLLNSLEQRNVQFEATLQSIRQGLVLASADGVMLMGNSRFSSMLGYDSFEQIKGQHLRECFEAAPALHCSSGHATHTYSGDLEHFADSPNPEALLVKTNTNRTLELEKIRDTGEGFVIAIQDITESVLSRRLEHLVNHDSLTNLASRHAFNNAIEAARASIQEGEQFTLFCMDLDRFKIVNDTLGHAFGDELLKQVARRISEGAPETTMIARLGGDEFAILIKGAAEDAETVAFAEAIISALRQPFEIENQIIRTGVSIGIAQAPAHGRDASVLLRRADIAMYEAKATGGNAFTIFSHEMETRFAERNELEKDLKLAIVNDELLLHYQPIICTKTRKISGFEALVRWQHPTLGLISPDKFIPLAEETGFIRAIGRWVLAAATEEASNWPDHYSVSVNLSAVQFLNRRLVREVEDALITSGLQPQRLHLEITESVLMDQSEFTKSILEGLHGFGVNINLDDFGAGYSSFNYILEFGFQRVKIDKVFLQDRYDHRKAHAILTALTSFCRDLNIETVAEGVESETHLKLLEDIQVDALQGYYFSRPVEAEKARELMGLRHSKHNRPEVA